MSDSAAMLGSLLTQVKRTGRKIYLIIHVETGALRTSIEEMAFEGSIEPYLDYITINVFKMLSNRDLIKFDEKYIKVVFFACMSSSNVYKINSEREVEDGYVDIYLEKDGRMPGVKYEWLIELKYLKKGDRSKLAEVKERGLGQLRQYAESSRFKDKPDLKKALVVFTGKDRYIVEII